MKNLFKSAFYSVFAIVILLLIVSCEKDSKSDLDTSIESVEENQYNEEVEFLAQTIARSMSDVNGRTFLKTEAIKQFDGDYDILFAEIVNKELNSTSLKSTQCNDYLKYLSVYANDESCLKSSVDFEAIINSIMQNNPLLQISIPELSEFSPEDWDESESAPLVAILPENYDESTTKNIKAFDIDGNVYELDILSEPDIPVVVIGENERLIAVNKETSLKSLSPDQIVSDCYDTYYETSSYRYLIPIDCGYSDSDGGDDSNNTSSAYDRDSNDSNDVLNKAKFVSKTAWRQVEPWPSGRPEFKVVISYIEKVNSEYEAKTIIKILPKDGWVKRYVFWSELKTKNLDINIINWDKEIMGDRMKYTWIEQDNSDTKTEYSIGTTTKFDDSNTAITASVKVTNSAKDDEAGEAVIEYKDSTTGEGTEYNTGIVKFWINQ